MVGYIRQESCTGLQKVKGESWLKHMRATTAPNANKGVHGLCTQGECCVHEGAWPSNKQHQSACRLTAMPLQEPSMQSLWCMQRCTTHKRRSVLAQGRKHAEQGRQLAAAMPYVCAMPSQSTKGQEADFRNQPHTYVGRQAGRQAHEIADNKPPRQCWPACRHGGSTMRHTVWHVCMACNTVLHSHQATTKATLISARVSE